MSYITYVNDFAKLNRLIVKQSCMPKSQTYIADLIRGPNVGTKIDSWQRRRKNKRQVIDHNSKMYRKKAELKSEEEKGSKTRSN